MLNYSKPTEGYMQELTMCEIDDVSGGKIAAWLFILNAAADFLEGFSDGYKAPK